MKTPLGELRALLERLPEDWRSRLRFAALLHGAGRTSEACDEYEIVAMQLARARYLIKQSAVLEEILRLEPKRSHVRAKLADLYRLLGLEDEALELEESPETTPRLRE